MKGERDHVVYRFSENKDRQQREEEEKTIILTNNVFGARIIWTTTRPIPREEYECNNSKLCVSERDSPTVPCGCKIIIETELPVRAC